MGTQLPLSRLVKSQKKDKEIFFTEGGQDFRLIVTLRYDDECGNGHNSFGMTGSLCEKTKFGKWKNIAGGCMHEEIVKRAPEFAKYEKWHLCSSDGPLHYVANTTFHAGDRDCHGGVEGEVSAYEYGVGLPNSNTLLIYDWLNPDGKVFMTTKVLAEKMVEQIEGSRLLKIPSLIHEGKEPDFKAARSCAIWPEATDEELSAEKNVLTEKLLARLPALMVDFKAAMESIGFIY